MKIIIKAIYKATERNFNLNLIIFFADFKVCGHRYLLNLEAGKFNQILFFFKSVVFEDYDTLSRCQSRHKIKQ
jgi:hypothetical protein